MRVQDKLRSAKGPFQTTATNEGNNTTPITVLKQSQLEAKDPPSPATGPTIMDVDDVRHNDSITGCVENSMVATGSASTSASALVAGE